MLIIDTVQPYDTHFIETSLDLSVQVPWGEPTISASTTGFTVALETSLGTSTYVMTPPVDPGFTLLIGEDAIEITDVDLVYFPEEPSLLWMITWQHQDLGNRVVVW